MRKNKRKNKILIIVVLIMVALVSAEVAILASMRNSENEAAMSESTENEIDIKRSTSSSKWESDISEIEARYGDDIPKGAVVFYGSSSIRKWSSLAEDMSDIEALNHGFGGAKTSDCLYYADRMVVAFKPKAVVYYAGTNDIGKGRTVEEAYADTVDFIEYVHEELPKTQIYYISQTQQPKRSGKWSQMQELNEKVHEYSLVDDRVTYIDTTTVLNMEDGSCRTELFLNDGLHFNSDGYEVWASIIRPVLYADLVK